MASQSFDAFNRGAESELNEEDEHIIRLIEERDLLLKTGTYATSDDIIANLEREIQLLTKRKR